MGFKARKRRSYVVTVDPDDGREGSIEFGGHECDNGWTGGVTIATWYRQHDNGGRAPYSVERLVNLANREPRIVGKRVDELRAAEGDAA